MSPEDALHLRSILGQVDNIQIVGVVTNMCVISNAIILQSLWPDANLTINAALCRSFDSALHEKALDVMRGLQMNVIPD